MKMLNHNKANWMKLHRHCLMDHRGTIAKTRLKTLVSQEDKKLINMEEVFTSRISQF
jgi:hypothetical protein